ncbi:four-carbon acid sugar kinase family protein [Lichenihabitans sp. Uapishka_5]|uniref:3-oxo-tetronate kinase n=1 Tax=Lichenihabitans sp. Uapishka_5 TaxID=3037302 RepID=UPI0029E7DF20|nr:3-oxo-tetronate kinase [Lichenihabitans sp. Uapishka_5]MDX7952624.1 four-carbon acid sugar kinase family protein [Lichenihabitans sp. Uapishka_5]
MLLGCIADDLTGATDLALTLAQEGMRTVQSTGVPRPDLDVTEVDALVVALKSRSIPAGDAVAQSLAALDALQRLGAERILFKYCSTFDSTDAGNIGPVGEALLERLGGGVAVACPAFPRAGRTIYAGQLFVLGVPLDESPMKDHPLNPMRDADLRRVLARQSRRPVGHVGFADVDTGPERIAAALTREDREGRGLCIVDAVTDRHLRDIGAAIAGHRLVTGGSGIAMGLPAAYVAAGLMPQLYPPPARMAAPAGRAAILSGSCSAATRAQVATARDAGMPFFAVDAALAQEDDPAARVLDWVATQTGDGPLLVSSSADPDAIAQAKALLGPGAGERFEAILAEVARGLVVRGVRRLLVAGGETSGAVVQALGVSALTIGPEIDPGVPWTRSVGAPDLALALKSGNFGAPDFFLKAWDLLR